MKKTIWIPKPLDKVIYTGTSEEKTAQLLSCNLGGKCKIRIGRKTIENVDISDLKPILVNHRK